VEALAIHPRTGVLYGVDDVTNQLLTINPQTGAGTVVGPLGVAITDMGLSFNGGGNLFMSTDVPANAFRLNTMTGGATVLGPQGQFVTGLTWRCGVLFGLGGDQANNLVTLNQTTGSATVVGPLMTVGVDDGGLDFDQNGVLWGINDAGRIFRINPSTGAATLGPTTLTGFEGLP
jgi:hypothetical protein